MNFTDIEQLLESKRPDIKTVNWFFALEDMQAFMDRLGNPQESAKVIHIAGTSGKTSTCYYLAEFLRLLSVPVGLTVSPHVSDLRERLQVNGAILSQEQYLQLFEEFINIPVVESMNITYFGLLVAFAYWVINKQQLDYAVIEVGMGGRLDATNVIKNHDKVCVITDIGLDHTQFLGETLQAIALEKAGIIQEGNHVFVAEQDEVVMRVFRNVCNKKRAILHTMPSGEIDKAPEELSLFQRRNWSLAKYVFRFVVERDNLTSLSNAQWQKSTELVIPARMQQFNYRGKTIIVDVSHNAQKIMALSEALRQRYPGQTIATLISMVEGKDTSLAESLLALHDVCDRLIVTQFRKSQDMTRAPIRPSIIAEHAQKAGFHDIEVCDDPIQAFGKLINSPEEILLVTGSFFLVNHVYPIITGGQL